MAVCDVCEGSGTYPVINRYGSTRYEIQCPECCGEGETFTDEEWAQRAFAERQAAKYQQAMDEKRALAQAEGRAPKEDAR